MYKLQIKLKQHTPLIHFQHDQEGATLRASEVKPKLDKFVITKLGNGNYQAGKDIAKKNGWLVGNGEHPALDYKMRIEADNVEIWNINELITYQRKHEQNKKPKIDIGEKSYLAKKRKSDGRIICKLEPYPLYFANLDADYLNPLEYRKFSFTEKPIMVSFICHNKSVFYILNNPDLLNNFFFQTNFGTRQSKGFGSFYIANTDNLYLSKYSDYRFCLDANDWDDLEYINDEYKRVFEYIDLFYKSIRSGINLKNKERTVFYFKSLAYLYAKNVLKAKWDKRKVKEEFYGINKERATQTFDIRDMLGFSTNEQWLSYHDSIEKKSDVAERMMSPLLFKPIYNESTCQYTINIIFQDEKVDLDGFKKIQTIKVISKNRKKEFSIDVPQNFSTKSLFEYIFGELNFDIFSHVDENYHNHRFFSVLENIYNQIKDNL